MLRIKPFAAVHPLPNIADQVSSVPYDVVTSDEARELVQGNPRSFLHVLKPEIDLPVGTDPYSDEVYAKADQALRKLISDGDLVNQDKPLIYLYRQVFEDRAQIGLVCCCHIDDYNNDVIKKHEKTRADKEDDRTRHVDALNAQPGPVFMTYRDQSAVDDLVAIDINDRPLFHFIAPDEVTHTVWTASNSQAYCDIFAKLDCAYIADGHHRSAAAVRVGSQRRAANPIHTGDEEYNWFLSVLFPASQLTILPYNRVVIDLADKTVEQALNQLSSIGCISETDGAKPDRPGEFCFYVNGKWSLLKLDESTIDQTHPINSLDVALLQDRVLGPVFGIGDPRSDKKIDFVGGIDGTAKLMRKVDSGKAQIAFSLYPTSIEQLISVADAGLVMPPKSTWFEPKLRSGLLIHMLD